MKNAIITADLFRAAAVAMSTEETRYYLNGVFVEPHATKRGITLTATDGHRLICAYDAEGTTDAPGIVNLPAALIKELKRSTRNRGLGQRRLIEITEGVPTITELAPLTDDQRKAKDAPAYTDRERRPIARGVEPCLIDGTFPDWRRVVPRELFGKPNAPQGYSFNAYYLGSFATAAGALWDHENDASPREKEAGVGISLYATDPGAPALIRFLVSQLAFGVCMPMRGIAKPAELPAFMDAPKAAAPATVQEAA